MISYEWKSFNKVHSEASKYDFYVILSIILFILTFETEKDQIINAHLNQT